MGGFSWASTAARLNFLCQVILSVIREEFSLRHAVHLSRIRSSIREIQSSTGVLAAVRPK